MYPGRHGHRSGMEGAGLNSRDPTVVQYSRQGQTVERVERLPGRLMSSEYRRSAVVVPNWTEPAAGHPVDPAGRGTAQGGRRSRSGGRLRAGPRTRLGGRVRLSRALKQGQPPRAEEASGNGARGRRGPSGPGQDCRETISMGQGSLRFGPEPSPPGRASGRSGTLSKSGRRRPVRRATRAATNPY